MRQITIKGQTYSSIKALAKDYNVNYNTLTDWTPSRTDKEVEKYLLGKQEYQAFKHNKAFTIGNQSYTMHQLADKLNINYKALCRYHMQYGEVEFEKFVQEYARLGHNPNKRMMMLNGQWLTIKEYAKQTNDHYHNVIRKYNKTLGLERQQYMHSNDRL